MAGLPAEYLLWLVSIRWWCPSWVLTALYICVSANRAPLTHPNLTSFDPSRGDQKRRNNNTKVHHVVYSTQYNTGPRYGHYYVLYMG